MKKTINKKNNIKMYFCRLTSAIVLTAGVIMLLLGQVISLPVRAADDPANAQTVTISTAEELVAYSQEYRGNGLVYQHNQYDTLKITITSGNVLTNDQFYSLGTLERPFSGKIILSGASLNNFDLFDCPLFDYVSTDMRVYASYTSDEVNTPGEINIYRKRKIDGSHVDGTLTSGALFANHVVKGTIYDDGANWTINLRSYTPQQNDTIVNSDSYEGLIGDIAANATVTVSFTNNTNIPVSSSNNVGLICGTLGAGATLNVTTAGSGSNISVTSSGGHAGGLVGEMKTGAKLKFDSANNTGVTSVTTSASEKFAGGIVGYVTNVTGTDNFSFKAGVTDYTVNCTVSGEGGAGGLFGYYGNSIESFSLENTYAITSGMVIVASNNNAAAGGVFGLLENYASAFEFDGNSSGGEILNVVISSGTSRGGVCGSYRTNALTDTFTITDTVVTIDSSGTGSGGLIGMVITNPAYIVIPGTTVTVSGGKLGGGLIGSIIDEGTFVDVSGTVTVTGSSQAGLIGTMTEGVLRIQGTTNISGLTGADGQIVNNRGRALIYALGDGEGTNGNWTLKRNNNMATDDVYSWGEVLRVDGTILSESDLFTIDGSAHTVTVAEPVTLMATIIDFAKTALNIQLRTADGKGALLFSSDIQSSTLLSGTLSITNDISLAGTGITGLTCDNGTNAVFSGTFNGNSKVLTFATGETYGLKSDGTALDSNAKQGNIYHHGYNGLFAKTSGATINNITLAGNFNIRQAINTLYLGGVSAYATNSLKLSGVNSNFTINTTNNDKTSFFGGAIGVGNGNNLNISITGGNLNPTYNDNSGNANGTSYVGGAIGQINYAETQTISFSSCDLGLTFGKTGSNARLSSFGTAIARIENGTYTKNKRNITLSDIDVNITANGQTKNNDFGAILGMKWYASDVTLNNVRINASITATGTANFGGLIKEATGYWNVQKISLGAAKFNVTATGSTFGFIANKTFVNGDEGQSALYLDVNNISDNYNIASLDLTGITGTFTTYDEIVANSLATGVDISANGQSIISITTTTSGNSYIINTSESTVVNTSTSCNTYLNKTSYGKSNVSINPNTRYYYNVAYARANTATSKYNFFVWTLKQYAHSSLAAWFTSSNTFTGNLDMTGISYYPVDLTSEVSFSNATIKLDNVLMENNVKFVYDNNGTATGTTRTTRSNTNQHYLMHASVFRNVSADITISGLSIQGNVPKLSDNFCGFLVSGTFGGNDTGAPTVFTATTVTFDGVYITNAGNGITDTSYAPLFINKIGKRVNVSITGASQSSAYSGFAARSQYAASSLIGDVGNESANTITITFSQMKFDGRSSATSIGNMDSTYSTTKSIFSRATLLNSFMYAGVGYGTGTYNFTLADDWGTGTAVHNVTYGSEITSSVENAGKQKKYYSSDKFTHPTTYESAVEYDFSTGFLPYVYESYNLGQYKHELNVNVSYDSYIEGYGKYDSPYIINGDKLELIAKIIKGVDVTSQVKINLPGDLANCDYTSTGYARGKYSFNTGSYTLEQTFSGNPLANPTNIQVRKYLSGAYYLINGNITLGSTYVGLGDTTSSNPEYAFRGVIIGKKTGDVCPTITNNSPNPLILTSLGCVIKDLIIDVHVDYNSSNVITLTAPDNDDSFDYSGGIKTYGAVIGQIFGGDTIIDNVDATFSSVSFNFSGDENTTFTRLSPVGGYVGALVNGGLIFRNMTVSNVGLTNEKCDKINNTGYLYVNPIIGRVIAGYAFHETSTYAVTSSSIPNGNKNYTISDLSLSSGKLSVKDSNDAGALQVRIPDGQAMFVLGAIVNSGAASAEYNSSTEQPYENLTAPWQAYCDNTTVRGGSGYSTVGTSTGDDYTKACNDIYTFNDINTSDRTKVPYIIRVYTTSLSKSGANADVYFARSLSTKENLVLYVTGDCIVASGFRGIGSIYLDSDNVRLRISKMYGDDGSGTAANRTITLNMRFLEYDPTITSYKAAQNTAGFGLFNILQINSASSSNSIYKLTLSGSVFYDIKNVKTGSSSQYKFLKKDSDGIAEGSVLNVGGVAGYVGKATNYDKYDLEEIIMANLSVEGAKYAGGLIGYSGESTKMSLINKCGTDSTFGISVTAGATAGGFIGYLRSYVTITGDSTSKTTLLINKIQSKGQDTALYTNPDDPKKTMNNINDPDKLAVQYMNNFIFYSAGGVIGLVVPQAKSPASSIKDYVIRGKGTGDSNHIFSTTTEYTNAGGVVGALENRQLSITNVDIQNLNVSASYAGGIVGIAYSAKVFSNNGDMPDVTLNNIKFDGKSNGKENNSRITGFISAGGFIGCMDNYDQGNGGGRFTINIGEIKNYSITSSTDGDIGNQAAGGFLGYSNPGTKNANACLIASIRNFLVESCAISNAASGTKTSNGTGGLFGMTQRTKIDGYNILINGTSVTSNVSDARTSSVIGNYSKDQYSYVKLVGVSINLTGDSTSGTKSRAVGKSSGLESVGEYYGLGDYIVFADYNQRSAEQNPNSAFATIVSCTNVDVASPYVTANPFITRGGKTITGDGVAADVSNLAITSIKSDYEHEPTSQVYIYNYSTSQFFNEFAPYYDNLIMFKNEQTGYSDYAGDDFPVLLLNDTSRDNSHRMINNYLRLLTNTDFDFGTDVANKYSVVIYKVTCAGGNLSAVAGGASLIRFDGKFCMANNYDNGKNDPQFSLIDVQFYDPSGSGKIAYHLFVPVFVKKVMTFDFDIAALSGTEYLSGLYTNRFGVPTIENAGTPVTLYFQYRYSYSSGEWESIINSGDNVHSNYSKSIVFAKGNQEPLLSDYQSNTILVLVDKQTGIPYYGIIGNGDANNPTGVLQGSMINLNAFKSRMTYSNGEYSIDEDSASFEPQTLDSLLNLSVTSVGDGRYLVTCSENEATVVVNGQFYRIGTSAELSNNNITKYKVELPENDYIKEEAYYLSLFTDNSDNAFHFHLISSQPSFSEVPSKLEVEGSSVHRSVHLVTGKIFEHNSIGLSCDTLDHSTVMTGTNNSLIASLSVSLGINNLLEDETKDTVRGYINATGVYQSFLIYLNRYVDGVPDKVVLGNPSVSGTYSIAGGAPSQYPESDINKNQGYIEVISPQLSSYFDSNDSFVLDSTVTIVYSTSAIPTQFPWQGETQPADTNGVAVSSTSNIAFQKTATSYSKNRIVSSETLDRYHSEKPNNEAVLDLNPVGDRLGDLTPLGINALNNNNATTASFDLLAVLDITGVADQIGEYTKARVTIELQQKQANGTYSSVNMGNYITSVNIANGVGNITPGSTLTREIPVDKLDTSSATSVGIPQLRFTVKTGSALESVDGYVYSNYKIIITVALYNGNDKILISEAHNYIIYTNAKVSPEFISVQ